MRVLASAFVASGMSISACALHPVPSHHLERSEATVRAARAVGAAYDPDAAVHLRLAEAQLDEAKDLISAGHNEAADWMLARAYSDAQLAEALALEDFTRSDAARAAVQADTLRRTRTR